MFDRLEKRDFARTALASFARRSAQVHLEAASAQTKQNIMSITIIQGRALSGGEVSA